MDYEEAFIVRKSDAPVKKELFNKYSFIIYVSYLVGVAPKHCFHRIFQRWGRGPLFFHNTISNEILLVQVRPASSFLGVMIAEG